MNEMPAPQARETPAAPESPKREPYARMTEEQAQLAEALYIAGCKPVEIAAHLSISLPAINTRVVRDGWAAKRAAAKLALEKIADPQQANTLALARKKFMDDMADVTVKGGEFLKNNPPLNRKQARMHFQTAKDVMEVAKPVLGISDDNAGAAAPMTLQFLIAPGQFARPVSGSDKTVEA